MKDKKKKTDLSRMPTPYEARRDALQIESNILLTFAIILLMMLQIDGLKTGLGAFYNILILVVFIAILVVNVHLSLSFKKFYNNWIFWVKK